MKKRKTASRSRKVTVQFDKTKMPEIIDWLKKQKNPEISIYMLIRMAQQIGGNNDWTDVTQKLASQVIFGKQAPITPVNQSALTAPSNSQISQVANKDKKTSKPKTKLTKENKATPSDERQTKLNLKTKKTKPKKVDKKDLKGLGINKTWN